MTSLVRRFLRTAVAFLAFGLALGVWMIGRRELLGEAPSAYLVSAHTHAILVGFVMMMILGVALWMFPRAKKGGPRYRPALAEVAYWLVAVGTGVRVVAELARTSSAAIALRWVVVLAGTAQAVGLVLFFFTMWPRIRAVGSATREAAGERF